MIGNVLTALLMLFCAIYWTARLSPPFERRLLEGAGRILGACRAPQRWQTAVSGAVARRKLAEKKRADAKRAGCAGCAGCDNGGGGCH